MRYVVEQRHLQFDIVSAKVLVFSINTNQMEDDNNNFENLYYSVIIVNAKFSANARQVFSLAKTVLTALDIYVLSSSHGLVRNKTP